jgi:uncharacterized protein (TIGR02996 family)
MSTTLDPLTADATQAGLMEAILRNPADDAPRLILADWLDIDGPPECRDPARAEFIRVQCELARLGPPHVVVNERCVVSRPYGPDYYSLTGGEGTEGGGLLILDVKVGDRVDVLKPRGKKGLPLYGLRVHKITDDEVIVVNDAKSGPWPGAALRRRERAILREWIRWPNGAEGTREAWWYEQMAAAGIRLHDLPAYRRGFVARVECTLTTFVGGPCGRCYGTGLHNRLNPGQTDPCPACSGSGRLPGIAAALFKSQPVEGVRLTDREPLAFSSGKCSGRFGWNWTDGEPEDPEDIPIAMYEIMVAAEPDRENGAWLFFDSADAARAALSAACVRYGRTLAGIE